MAEYSERDLLMLSNYVYFTCSTNEGTIGENIAALKNEDGSYDIQKLYRQGAISCNISKDEAIRFLDDLEADEKLSGLKTLKCLEEKDIRAVCYGNGEKDGSCVIFRGTGGTYDAWYDNVTGEYEEDTKLQKVAADFVKNKCSEYENITVSGHSKGGNLAQYVTVVCDEKIDKCISYDGQGFGKKFIRSYKNEIKNAQNKITSISAYNDYVNILLTAIAGKRLFMRNSGQLLDGHSSFTLLDSITFNDDGSINEKASRVIQGPAAYALEKAIGNITNVIDIMPDNGAEKVSNIIGTFVSAIMSDDMGEEYEKTQFIDAVKAFGSYSENMLSALGSINTPFSIVFCNNEFNSVSAKRACSMVDDMLRMLDHIACQIEEISRNIDYSITGRVYTDKALAEIINKTYHNRKVVEKLRNGLIEIIRIYEEDETYLSTSLQNLSY